MRQTLPACGSLPVKDMPGTAGQEELQAFAVTLKYSCFSYNTAYFQLIDMGGKNKPPFVFPFLAKEPYIINSFI